MVTLYVSLYGDPLQRLYRATLPMPSLCDVPRLCDYLRPVKVSVAGTYYPVPPTSLHTNILYLYIYNICSAGDTHLPLAVAVS